MRLVNHQILEVTSLSKNIHPMKLELYLYLLLLATCFIFYNHLGSIVVSSYSLLDLVVFHEEDDSHEKKSLELQLSLVSYAMCGCAMNAMFWHWNFDDLNLISLKFVEKTLEQLSLPPQPSQDAPNTWRTKPSHQISCFDSLFPCSNIM